jgi:hypothetical protein
MSKLLQRAILSIILVLALSPGTARVIDPGAQTDPLLDALARDLDTRGIDVRRGSTSSAEFLASRPQLTRLNNFPIAEASFGSEGFSFQRFFNAGAFTESTLLAVGQAPPTPPGDNKAFERTWTTAPKEQRVFISFSGRDLSYAQRVAAALEAKGYATFLYRNEAGSLKYNAVEVGQFFSEAGQHLALDTANARKSAAVKAEALAYLALKRGGVAPLRPIVPPSPAGPSTQSRQPCCKLCTYQNGILVGCGPRECGPQCLGAR